MWFPRSADSLARARVVRNVVSPCATDNAVSPERCTGQRLRHGRTGRVVRRTRRLRDRRGILGRVVLGHRMDSGQRVPSRYHLKFKLLIARDPMSSGNTGVSATNEFHMNNKYQQILKKNQKSIKTVFSSFGPTLLCLLYLRRVYLRYVLRFEKTK